MNEMISGCVLGRWHASPQCSWQGTPGDLMVVILSPFPPFSRALTALLETREGFEMGSQIGGRDTAPVNQACTPVFSLRPKGGKEAPSKF